MRWVEELPKPPPASLATMVHVPEVSGYWEESPQVLDLCLDSLLGTTPAECELLVLDNGSCGEVRAGLVERFQRGEIDQLFFSRRNLGKVGGWNLLFAAAAGEVVAYFDSDVLFLPGWWEDSKAVLDAFPEAAMVTAQPIPGDLSLHCDATLAGAAADPTVDVREADDLIPPSYVESQRRGLGEGVESHRRRLARRRDVELVRGSTTAYVSASHFQFMSRRAVLERFFPLPTRIPLGDDAELDRRLDEAGYWRLSTVRYRVHHMGNRRPDLAVELPWWEGAGGESRCRPSQRRRSRRRRRWLDPWLERGPVRRLLKRVHRLTYEWLYPRE